MVNWDLNEIKINVSNHAIMRFVERGHDYIKENNIKDYRVEIESLIRKADSILLFNEETNRRLYKYENWVFILDLNLYDARSVEVIVVTCWLVNLFKKEYFINSKLIISEKALENFKYFVKDDDLLARNFSASGLSELEVSQIMRNLLKESNYEPLSKIGEYSSDLVFNVFRWYFKISHEVVEGKNYITIEDCWLKRAVKIEDLDKFNLCFGVSARRFFLDLFTKNKHYIKRYKQIFNVDFKCFSSDYDWLGFLKKILTLTDNWRFDKNDKNQTIVYFDDLRFFLTLDFSVNEVIILVVKFSSNSIQGRISNGKQPRKKWKSYGAKEIRKVLHRDKRLNYFDSY